MQTTACYQIAYLPKYPEKSDEDSAITCNHVTGTWFNTGVHAAGVALP